MFLTETELQESIQIALVEKENTLSNLIKYHSTTTPWVFRVGNAMFLSMNHTSSYWTQVLAQNLEPFQEMLLQILQIVD